ncbi:MAG: DUF2461 domain-containing protein [Deltaproteobacteria bacterium]|nr:DUF2461 domain-containing protein [Deltaproteobacteria bacterium]
MAKKEEVGPFEGFNSGTLKFLVGLSLNNEREWFEAHREDYQRDVLEPARRLVAALGPRLRKFAPKVQFEPKVNGSVFRIYRDTRFSKDKTPYKTNVALWFWEGGNHGWGDSGFYLSIEPGRFLLGAGRYHFGPEELAAFRRDVADKKRGASLERAIATVERAGYGVHGENYKRVPKPYPKDHPRAALLRHDSLYASFSGKVPRELTSAKLVDYCLKHYAKLAPIHRWLVDRR